jgi:HlyD family secretion protein
MKKKMIWVGTAVVLTLSAVLAIAINEKAYDVELGIVERGNVETYVEENAVVNLEKEASIYALQGGRVTEMLEAGKTVKAGEVLAKMDDVEVAFQIEALEAQKQSIAAQYEEEKKPVDGDEIKKLKAQINSAQVAYNEAKRAAVNSKALYEAGSISYDEYQSSLAGMALAQSALESAKSNLTLAQKSISEGVEKQYEAQLSSIQAQIDILRKKKSDLDIKAPFDGMVLRKLVKEGSVVQPGAILFEFGGNNGFFLKSDILTDEIRGVKPGAAVLITNEDLDIKDVRGTIRNVSPIALSKVSELGIEQKRVEVEISIDEEIAGLRAGYDMDIKIITDSRKDALIVDERAIFEFQGKNYVFINDSGTARLRMIKTGIKGDELVEVIEGLKEWEEVVLSPDANLEEGMKIK